MYIGVCTYMWVGSVGARGGQKRDSDSLELELQAGVSWYMSPGTEPGSSEAAANALKHRAIFLRPDFLIQCSKQNTTNGHTSVFLVLTQGLLLYRLDALRDQEHSRQARSLPYPLEVICLQTENEIGITAFANFSLSPFIFILCLILTNFYMCV